MASYADREAFIPYSRKDLEALCLEDGGLDARGCAAFKRFAEILAAYKHFEYLERVEALKHDFAPFNPDAVTIPLKTPDPEERTAMGARLTRALEAVLKRANYTPVTDKEIEEAFELDSLIKLATRVDFDDFEQCLLYARGRAPRTARFKTWRGTKELEFDTFERVVALIKFKEMDYFRSRGRRLDDLHFDPGKMYLYLYKNIPRYDLEVLFPNLEARMNLRDKLLFGVPALAAAGSVLFKSLSQIAVVIGVVLILIFGREAAQARFSVDEELTAADFVTLWAAVSSFLVGFGAVAFRQWNSYRSKKLKFQKEITETLFFKNIASNASVFYALVDEAEEEECKQMLLVYYHLMRADKPMTPEDLDDAIEAWFEQKFGVKIDFDIETTVQCLEAVRGPLPGRGEEAALIRRDADGRCRALPLDTANELVDALWDNLFPYANEAAAKSETGAEADA